jgi:hypothetical protein
MGRRSGGCAITARTTGTVTDAKRIGRAGIVLKRPAAARMSGRLMRGVIPLVRMPVAAVRMRMHRSRRAERRHPGQRDDRVEGDGRHAEPCRHPPCPDCHAHPVLQNGSCRLVIQRERGKYSTTPHHWR